jgi:hypothetical protein
MRDLKSTHKGGVYGPLTPPVLNQSLIQDTTNHSIFFLHKSYPTEKDRLSAVPDVTLREHFDEAFYLKQYPDIVQAITDGQFTDAWQHYERFGRLEGRRARP